MLSYKSAFCLLQIEQLLYQMHLIVSRRLFIHAKQSHYQIHCGIFFHNIVRNWSWQSKSNNSQYQSNKNVPFFILHSIRYLPQKRQMQLLPIEIILNLRSPKSKVCFIKLLNSWSLAFFSNHHFHSNLSSDTTFKVVISNYIVLALIPCQIWLYFLQSFSLYVCGFICKGWVWEIGEESNFKSWICGFHE